MSIRRLNERGFGLAELIVVLAVIGLLAALAMPSMLGYWRSATISAGAAEMASILNRGRAGLISLSNGLQISGGTATFTNAGGANLANYTVTDPRTSRTRIVQVTTTGRVTVQ